MAMRRTHFAAALAAGLAIWMPPIAARAACPAEAGECQALLESGTSGNRVDFVIVGDGYTAMQQAKFYADAAAVAQSLQTTSTYASYAPVFNVWALFVPSTESGADDPATGMMVDTAFDAAYGVAGIDYLMGVSDGKVLTEITERFPAFDVPICIVNADKYGGSGGIVAVASTHEQSVQILEHELGHTFANLADEYETPYPGFPPGDSEPNVALEENLTPLKWESWVPPGTPIPTPDGAATSDYAPVGAYEGARYLETGIYRPTLNCLMRELGKDFCSVCSEAMVLGFSSISVLVDGVTPPDMTAIPAKGPSSFSVITPALTTLEYTWTVDGVAVDGTAATVEIDPSAIGLGDGPHQITVSIHDATPLVRNDPTSIMTESFSWSFVVDSTLPPIGGEGGAGGAPPSDKPDDDDGEDDETEDDGCGCAVVGATESSAGGLLMLALILSIWRRRRRAGAVLSLLFVLSAIHAMAPTPAFAQAAPADASKEVARQRYEAGVKAFDAGQYEEARVAFSEAYKLTQAPGILLNLGVSELKTNRPVEAGNHLHKFLREYPDAKPEERTTAQSSLEECKRRAALVTVVVDVAGAEISIDGVQVGKSPLADPVFVEPGARAVVASGLGTAVTANVEAKKGQTVQASLRLGSTVGGPGESCRARSDCAEGLRCVDQVCHDDMEGATCATRPDCGGRLVCVDQICVIPGQSPKKTQPPTVEQPEPSSPPKELEGIRPHIGLMLGGGPSHTDDLDGPVVGSLLFAIKGGVFFDRVELGLEFAPATFVVEFDDFQNLTTVELNAYVGYHIPVAGPVSWPLRFGVGFTHFAPAGGASDDIFLEGRADLVGLSVLLDPVLLDFYVPSFRVNSDLDRSHFFTYVFGVGAAVLPI
jgi:MYXO-CTERM domain-containing protein